MAERPRSSYVSGLTLILLIVSIGVNALQARKIYGLVEPVKSPRSRVGQIARPLAGTDLDGRPVSLSFAGAQPTVIYFFSPTCRWCERNWNNVRTLARNSLGQFRLVGIALEKDLRAFAQARQLEFEIVGGISAEAVQGLGLGGTPHTLVVSSQGRISHEWSGAFDGRRERSVEAFFEIELPGLDPDQVPTNRR